MLSSYAHARSHNAQTRRCRSTTRNARLVEVSGKRQDDDDKGDCNTLDAGAEHRGEEHELRRRAEDIAVDLLPTVLLAEVPLLQARGSSASARQSDEGMTRTRAQNTHRE